MMVHWSSVQVMLAKEFRQLLPLLFALLALEIFGLVDLLLLSSPDENSWLDISGILDEESQTNYGSVLVLLGGVAAYMLFPHEQDQRTLAFLWALPVRRWQLYFYKVLAAWLLLAGFSLFSALVSVWVHSFVDHSVISQQFSWPLWKLEYALTVGALSVGLGYGMLVSYFRLAGVLCAVGLWIGIGIINLRYAEWRFLDPGQLLAVEFIGQTRGLSTMAWALHGGLAVLSLLLAAWLWVVGSERRGERAGQSSRSDIGGFIWPLALCLLFMFLTFGALFLELQTGELGEEERQLQSQTTERYEFSYYSGDEEAAKKLFEKADDLLARTEAMLGYQAEEPIFADITDSSENHLGKASWKKLRINRDALTDFKMRDHVLVHESAHVLAGLASERKLRQHYDYTIFFNEGLAEWVSYEILQEQPHNREQRRALRLLGAMAWQRLNLRFEDFLFSARFRQNFEENLLYALGELWVQNLVDNCGVDTPAATLRAMARDNAPDNLAGEAFWQDTLQAARCDYAELKVAFKQSMDELGELADGQPDVSGSMRVEGGKALVRVRLLNAPEEKYYRVYASLRDPDAPMNAVTKRATIGGGEETEFEIALADVTRSAGFEYQIGVEFLKGQRPFFHRWTSARQ